MAWGIYDETGRRVESTPDNGQPMALDGRDLGPLAVDLATTIEGPDGLRWRVLARRIGGGPHRGPHEAKSKEHRPRQPGRDERKGDRDGSRTAARTSWPPGPHWSRWRRRSDGWRPYFL